MNKEEAIRIFRKEIECLSHAKCEDCILEKVCDPAKTTPLDSEYIEAYGMAIQALSQEPCDDAVSRDALIAKLTELIKTSRSTIEIKAKLIPMIEQLPSVTQKSGKWIEHPEIETSTPEYLMFYECSECGNKQCFCKSDIHKKRFCSNCGAKMESEG